MARAMSHRLRFEIADALFTRNATAAEVAKELGQPVARVRYLLRVMLEEGLIVAVEERKRRGAVERVYAAADFVLDLDEFAVLPEKVKDRINAEVIRMAVADAVKAQRAGTLNNRDNSAFVRFPLLVDERGWATLAKLHRELLDRVAEIRDECSERLSADTSRKAVPVISINLLFELPRP